MALLVEEAKMILLKIQEFLSGLGVFDWIIAGAILIVVLLMGGKREFRAALILAIAYIFIRGQHEKNKASMVKYKEQIAADAAKLKTISNQIKELQERDVKDAAEEELLKVGIAELEEEKKGLKQHYETADVQTLVDDITSDLRNILDA